MKKAIAYKRISTKDQSNFSLPGQEKHINEFAAAENITIVGSFTDDGKSAKNFDRPDWKLLEAFVREHHRDVDYLIVIKYDRFSRNAAQGLQKIEWLEQKYRIMILSVFERMLIDYDSPFYFKQRADMLVSAEFELRVIRDRTKFGIHNALSSGRFINMAPFGYRNEREGKKVPVIKIVEEKALIIKKIFTMFLAGSNKIEIFRSAKLAGFTRTSHSAIPDVLTNCVYAGLIYVPAYKKEAAKYVKGVHDGIIDEHTYWQVQERLGNTLQKRNVLNPEVHLRGVLKHSCGKLLTAGNSRSKSGRYYWYYKCNDHRETNYSANKIHLQFDEVLQHLSLSDQHINYLTEAAHEEMKIQLQDRDKKIVQLRKELQAAMKNIDNLEEKFITGDLAPATYKKWYSKYAAAESSIRHQLAELEKNSEDKWNLFYTELPKLTDMQYLYQAADLSQKRTFVRQVFNSQLSYVDGIYRTPFLLPLLSHNTLILKQKGLLIVEQPPQLVAVNEGSTPNRSIIELHSSFLQLVAEIKTA